MLTEMKLAVGVEFASADVVVRSGDLWFADPSGASVRLPSRASVGLPSRASVGLSSGAPKLLARSSPSQHLENILFFKSI